MKMILLTLPCGDPVHRFDGNIVVSFRGKRKVLSTTAFNGGYRENLKYVFNHDGRCGLGVPAKMKGKNYYEHTLAVIREMGLDPDVTSGMETAAHMENVSVKTECCEDLAAVTAIVTGGIESNGGRVGDPATWIEQADVEPEYRLGTINIMLMIDADMSPGCMSRAMVTCTEAKTAAIQELLAPSRYSRGIATGSGTDDTIVVANTGSPRYLTNAGKHSKLGELIGITVKAAVKEALYLQTGLCPASQHNALNRMSRFAVSEESLFHFYQQNGGGLDRPDFSNRLEPVCAEGEAVALASVAAHMIDQKDWGLLSGEEAIQGVRLMTEGYAVKRKLKFIWETENTWDEEILLNWMRLMTAELEKE